MHWHVISFACILCVSYGHIVCHFHFFLFLSDASHLIHGLPFSILHFNLWQSHWDGRNECNEHACIMNDCPALNQFR